MRNVIKLVILKVLYVKSLAIDVTNRERPVSGSPQLESVDLSPPTEIGKPSVQVMLSNS